MWPDTWEKKVGAEHQRELPSHRSTRNFQRTRSRSGGNNNPWTELCVRVQTVGPRITGSNTLGQSRTNELNMLFSTRLEDKVAVVEHEVLAGDEKTG